MENTQHGSFLKIITLILFLILTALIAKGIYSKQAQLKELKRESSLLDKKISQVRHNIEQIKRRIRIAKNDPYYLKHEAQERYMIVSKDETIIIFSDNSSKNR